MGKGSGAYNAVGALTRIEMKRFIRQKAALLSARYKDCYYRDQHRNEFNKRK